MRYLVGIVLTLAVVFAVAAPASTPSTGECQPYLVEVSVAPTQEYGGQGYQALAALRHLDTGNRVVSLESSLRSGQSGSSARQLSDGSTFSMTIDVAADARSALYTLELTRDDQQLLFHRAQVQLGR